MERSRLRVMAWSAGDYGPSRFACNGEVGPRCATKQLDGQISKNPSSPFRENIPLNPSGKSALRLAHPVPREGRIAIVTDVGTVDAAASDASVIAGLLVRERSNGAQDERR